MLHLSRFVDIIDDIEIIKCIRCGFVARFDDK